MFVVCIEVVINLNSDIFICNIRWLVRLMILGQVILEQVCWVVMSFSSMTTYDFLSLSYIIQQLRDKVFFFYKKKLYNKKTQGVSTH